tara:strand:- start:137 stop:538 length:402 start_codon:yes stop_codon:yes gene_type:complete
MSAKKKKDWMSFTDKDGRWMQCKCCHEYVKVDGGTSAITCSSCTLKRALALKPVDEFFTKQKPKTGRPAGWHWMNEFVDKDGNVFHKGKEQPKLKGTLKPTKVKPPKKRKKLTEEEKLYKTIKEYKKRKKGKK